jgi:hypothetical protein
MAIAPFKYTDEEWTSVAKHLRADDDAAAVRAALQVTGLRYKLDVAANDIRGRRLRQKRRQETLKRARAFLAYLETVPADEKHGLQRPLAMIKAWIESDDLRLIDKSENAEKPAQNFVAEKVLQVWREKLGRKIPKRGGNPTGPVAKFLMDAANPIIEPDEITGDVARYLIRDVEKRRA